MTPKQQRFVEEYLVDLNATQAAIRGGYSAKTAEAAGSRLLRNVNVAAALSEAQALRAQTTGVTAQRVVEELAKIAFTDLADVTDWGVKEVAFGYDGDGKQLAPQDIGEAAMVRYVEAPFVTPINCEDLPAHARSAVAEVSLTKDGFKIKLHDKNAALVSLGRHLGMFKDKVEHSGAITLETLVMRSLTDEGPDVDQ